MFIGDTTHPTHLLQEIVDNSLDEVLNGLATKVEININNDIVSVEDDGRGILQGIYHKKGSPYNGKNITQLICEKNFSGEKFSNQVYDHSVGLHGLGLVVVNALSEYLTCEIYKDGGCNTYKFIDSKLVDTIPSSTDNKKSYTGTKVTFKPSSTYFETLKFDLKVLDKRLKMFKYLYPKSVIIINGEEVEASTLDKVHSSFNSKLPTVEIETDNYFLALTYDLEETNTHKYGYVNLLGVNEGSHLVYLTSMLKDVWAALSNGYEFDKEDCFLGMSLLCSAYLKNPQFSSQTKERLTSSRQDIREVFEGVDIELLDSLRSKEFYNSFTKPLLIRFQEYRKSMRRLKVIDYVKEAINYGDVSESDKGVIVNRKTTVKKLFDCTSTNRELTELYVVEGQSAGGSILQCRDLKIHAVLPLRGKPLNPMNMSLDKIVKNEEFCSLINALGTGVAPLEKPESVRYGKIIIVADADVDGKNIEAILLGGFLKLFPELINSGRLYVCEAPLYWQKKKGFIWDFNKVNLNKPFQRFKGLGEMNSDQIYEAIVNPVGRKLYQVVVDGFSDKEIAFQLVGNPIARREMLRLEGIVE
jgi:DNA gyrase subunit B